MTTTKKSKGKAYIQKNKEIQQAYEKEVVKNLLIILAHQVINLTRQGKNGKVNAQDWANEFTRIFNRLT